MAQQHPGHLKFEYANSADKTVHTAQTKEAALTAAQGLYAGVVALDQWGNAVFETETAGRAAKAQLLRNGHGDKTLPEMLKGYAVDDYTGKSNTDAYAQPVCAVGDSRGVDLRGKKIKDLSHTEYGALRDGMKKVEGFQEGSVTRTQPRADSGPEAMSPAQQNDCHMAAQALALQLGATHSPTQIDALARSAATVATENAGRGDVQGVLLCKDRQTIALKQAFGISEIGVQEALSRSPTDLALKVASNESPQPTQQSQQEAPQVAALSR